MKSPIISAVAAVRDYLKPMRTETQAVSEQLGQLRQEEQTLLSSRPTMDELTATISIDIAAWRLRILRDTSAAERIIAAASPRIGPDSAGALVARPRPTDTSAALSVLDGLPALVVLAPGAVVAGVLAILRETPIAHGLPMPERLSRLTTVRREIAELEQRQRDLGAEAAAIADEVRGSLR